MRSHAKASSAGSTLRQVKGLGILTIIALAVLAFASSAHAAKIPGGEPLAIFGPEAGTCDATQTVTATGTGDITEAGATGKGDATILATGSGTVSGDFSKGSRKITNLSTTTGEFKVGEEISGNFIREGATILAVAGNVLTMSKFASTFFGDQSVSLSSGSKTLTNVTTETGAFEVGQAVSGPGIPSGTTITAVGSGTLTLSRGASSAGTGTSLTAVSTKVVNLSASCGAFKVGQEVSGDGMPAETKISAVSAGTFTLPKAPIAEGIGIALTATTKFNNLFSTAASLAVDEAGRRLYAYDSNLVSDLAPRKISAFNLPGLTGSVVGFPLATAAGFGQSPVAVDNTESSSAGRLYFTDAEADEIYAFKPDGTELNIGNGFPNFPLQMSNPGAGGGGVAPCGARVDADGNLWIGDSAGYGPNSSESLLIREFSSSGVPLDTIEIPSLGRSSCGIAFDAQDNLYLSGNIAQLGGGVWKYGAANDYDPLLATRLGDGTSIALDKSRNLIYATVRPGAEIEGGVKVEVRTTGGDLLGSFAEGISDNLRSVAVDETGQRVYVADADSDRIYAFGFVDTPDVTTGVASGSDPTHETLRGQVNPLSNEVEDCHFEYISESEFNIFGWGHAVSVPCAQEPGAGTGPVEVSAELGGLPPATNYRVRLVAENANGRTFGSSRPFSTLGPVISGEGASEVTSTSAKLEATVNPNGEDTSYRFEYVGNVDFEDSGWAKAVSVPAGGAEIGNGSADVHVSQQVVGLAPGATYRFRAVATNASAALEGRGSALTTLLHDGTNCSNDAQRSGTSAHLPDCRAYEQVSPVEKGGFDIEPRWPVISSPDGEDVTYSSTGGFADSKIAGYPVAYVARRAAGWQTEGISAPVDPVTDLFVGMVYGASEDFGLQLVGTNAKLTPDAPKDGLQLYIHYSVDDSYQYVATIPAGGEFFPMGAAPLKVAYAGASSDGSSVFFSTSGEGDTTAEPSNPGFSLDSTPPPPATARRNFYEFDTTTGELKLVGVLPDDTTVEPAGSTAPHVSFPGSAFSQTAVKEATVSSNPVSSGGGVYWEGGGSLYRRESGHSTLVASGNPTFWRATPDGSFAFYQVGGGSLQRYDSADESSTDLGVEPFKVLGVSGDGEYAYFLSHGADAPGSFPAPGNSANLFVWHDGDTRLIARLPEADDFLGPERTVKWRVSPNGRYLGLLTGNPLQGRGFSFARQLVNPDTSGPYLRAYFYDYLADSFACASCTAGESGTPDGDVMFKPRPTFIGLQSFNQFHEESRNVTDAGQFFFSTTESLVEEDVNDKYDVYEYQSGGVSLISSGQSDDDSWFGDATPDGDAVFFTTREGLVGQDTDPNVDLYVARVNGGIASQSTNAQGAVCQDAEQCHGAATSAPSGAGPGTSAFEAPPQAQVRRCKAGKVRRKGRCSKPRRKQRHHGKRAHRRAAGDNRRAAR